MFYNVLDHFVTDGSCPSGRSDHKYFYNPANKQTNDHKNNTSLVEVIISHFRGKMLSDNNLNEILLSGKFASF